MSRTIRFFAALVAAFALVPAAGGTRTALPRSQPALAPHPAVASHPVPVRGAPASFADLSAQLLPTVVNIATTQTLKAGPQAALPNLPPGSPLEDLFKDLLGPKPNAPRHVTSLGSGFIIDPTGYIVTNNHVIEDSDNVTATLNDGEILPAKIVGRDIKTDLALLKVTPRKPMAFAHFGDSESARIGDWVIAIGNPFGLGSTVTAGIVSARNRIINAGDYDDFIQTDAPINRGNSGGPLFDMSGNVIGINSAIFSPSGGSVGIGFAIPSNLAREVIAQLRQFGAPRRGWVGLRIQQVTEDIAEGLGLPTASGALVAEVTPNGPAAKAGIVDGDLITSFDGRTIGDSRAVPRIVASTPVGKTVAVDVLRKGHKLTVHLTVQRLEEGSPAPLKPGAATPAPKSKLSALGLSLGLLDAGARQQFRLKANVQGVLVTDVAPDSPAANSLKPGDVIVEIRKQPVRTPDDVSRHLEADARSGRKVEVMLVNRSGELSYVALRLA
ncbi:MAG: Do family serine endopeptidase [Alphaproteobacteria bacterium]|nr:Do family serine endopeptidase [Alphaproteobacteria bacterium]